MLAQALLNGERAAENAMRKTVRKNLANLVANGDFRTGRTGEVPEGWEPVSRHGNGPVFRLATRGGRRMLLIEGNDSQDCFGYLRAPAELKAGRTYRLRVRFHVSRNVNPQLHLRFSFYADKEGDFNDGIFDFRRLGDGWVEGERRFRARGRRNTRGQVRIGYGFNARGKVYVAEISLSECEPIAPRPVRVAATGGNVPLKQWSRVLDAAGAQKADLVLLPETINGHVLESRRGPTGTMMARKARQYDMYVAGGICLQDRRRRRVYNTCLLFDRKGRPAGRYDKNHPYTPELWCDVGISPGSSVPVFRTDFGKIGILICYDSWFPDVTELLALKGAEIVLFPNAGYFRGLMPARAADNCVRMVVSSLGPSRGMWDTAGRDITDPLADASNHAGVRPRATAHHIRRRTVCGVELLVATLDLAQSPSPHNWGGPCLSAPGGRRNRREQTSLLYDKIRQECERWWEQM